MHTTRAGLEEGALLKVCLATAGQNILFGWIYKDGTIIDLILELDYQKKLKGNHV